MATKRGEALLQAKQALGSNQSFETILGRVFDAGRDAAREEGAHYQTRNYVLQKKEHDMPPRGGFGRTTMVLICMLTRTRNCLVKVTLEGDQPALDGYIAGEPRLAEAIERAHAD